MFVCQRSYVLMKMDCVGQTLTRLMENPCSLLASFASTAGTAGMCGQETGKQHSEEETKSRHGAKIYPSHTVQPCSQVLSHR